MVRGEKRELLRLTTSAMISWLPVGLKDSCNGKARGHLNKTAQKIRHEEVTNTSARGEEKEAATESVCTGKLSLRAIHYNQGAYYLSDIPYVIV